MKLDVKLRCFTQSGFHTPYFCNLAAYVEMNQPETVGHFVFLKQVERLEQFTGV
ncbi:hypothetical protein SDC9_168062 [bioreactor metagenome]|uniref:Uncharacterized protein n=1 Tax=bioreactor metagenome TaxID=1076179 RepID=A0A645G9W8_9ZZZZ